MIKVDYQEEQDSLRLTLTGHAGAGKRGTDIVCAAASMLTFTLAAELEQRARRGTLRPRISLQAGGAYFQAPNTPESRALFEYTLTGFGLLANRYPQYVNLRGNHYEGNS